MNTIYFTKMHGAGNDYIYVNCLEKMLENPGEVSIRMSPRHLSVGADGLVLICPSDVADVKMRMFNADGSEGKMCGNAIRCIGKYFYENGFTEKTDLSVETLSGIKYLKLTVENKKVVSVTVDMGYASLEPKDIPVLADAPVRDMPIKAGGNVYRITCVSMGNPHAVTYVDDVSVLPLEKIGPYFENHALFPDRTNTEFVEVISRTQLKMRVWERGSGETFACGTGTCAAVVSSILNGYCDYNTPVTVDLVGGQLTVSCTEDLHVTMTGNAIKVYDGVFEYED